MNIIARKPRSADGKTEFVVVKRVVGAAPFVVGTATEESLANGEWFWGHYFPTQQAAMDYFDAQKGDS